jgi:hypothetical protein
MLFLKENNVISVTNQNDAKKYPSVVETDG